MTELFRHIGPYTDVPAGDIGVGAREIGYNCFALAIFLHLSIDPLYLFVCLSRHETFATHLTICFRT